MKCVSCVYERGNAVSCEASCTALEVYWPSFSKPLLSVIFLRIFSMMMAFMVAIVFSITNLDFFVVDKCPVWNVEITLDGQ